MSKFPRALILATSIYSLLIWAYVCIQIITNNASVFDRFIYWIPVSFYVLGMITFLTSFACMVVYLTFWGFSGKPLFRRSRHAEAAERRQ